MKENPKEKHNKIYRSDRHITKTDVHKTHYKHCSLSWEEKK